ncbi:MAG: serine/threonine-protein phosphatase [Candidatus Hydrogenedentes bacterium]|nr:serine/threonine-protein phosphatase [Candidatus Hydrogenedentota bacterium]
MSQSEPNLTTIETPAAAPEDEACAPRALYACKSVQGMRESNQDVALAGQIATQDGTPVTVAAVCDGMGGHKAGERASHLAAHAGLATLIAGVLGLPADSRAQEMPAVMLETFQSANIDVMAEAARNPACRDMGTTMVMAVLVGTRLYVGNVGDSRTYFYHEEALEPLTHDDSVVQILMDLGQISLREAENHPRSNEITRCIGTVDALDDFGVTIHSVEPGDCIVLCSDGLWKACEEDIHATCAGLSTQPFTPAILDRAARNLIGQALARGSDDNITVVLIWLEPKRLDLLCTMETASNNAEPEEV